jgi:lipoate-protein ligase A
MARPARERAGALRVYDLAGTVLSLGRYHLAPSPRPGAVAITLLRRHSGGRVAPGGEGFVGATLVLPHRAALVASDPLALAPEQVMNRHVRGVLAGLQRLGVSAHYPGRDLITVGGRVIGLVAFEIDAAGSLLFEVVLAVAREWSVLPGLLDAVDPDGVVKATMWTPDDTTSIAKELGRAVGTEELADQLCNGYQTRMGVDFARRTLEDPPGSEDPGWLAGRRPRPDLDRRATVSGQIGVIEVLCAVDGGRLREVVVAGDLIAPSAAIASLEDELRGCPAERAAIDAVVQRVFAPPERFILGVRPLGVIADAIARAVAA